MNRIAEVRRRRHRVMLAVAIVLSAILGAVIALKYTTAKDTKHTGLNPYDVTFQPYMFPDFAHRRAAQPATKTVQTLPWMSWYQWFHTKGILSAGADRKYLVYTSTCKHQIHCKDFLARLSGAISAFYLAMLINRTFVIRWQGPGYLNGRYFEPNKIDWADRPGLYNDLPYQKYYFALKDHNMPTHIEGYATKLFIDEEFFLKWISKSDLSKMFSKPVVFLETSVYFAEALLRNEKIIHRAEHLGLVSLLNPKYPFAMLGQGMGYLFKNAAYLAKMLSKSKFIAHGLLRPCIGIHARTFSAKKSQLFDKLRIKEILNCARKIEIFLKGKSIELNSKNITWYLATDDQTFKTTALNYFPGKITTLDISTEQSKSSQDLVSNVFIDQMMLSECDFLLSTRGGIFNRFVQGCRGFSTSNVVSEGECESLEEGKVELALLNKRTYQWL